MIVFINAKLNTWADWVASGRKVVGLGYPSQVPYMRMTPNAHTLRSPIENEDAWEMERAVHRLDGKLRETVEQFYLRAGTADSHARALHCCRDTLYVRLHSAHVAIMDWMQGCDEANNYYLTQSDTFDTKHVR